MMSGAKKRILVVDDEASVLLTYKLILEQQGYEVVGVPTSKLGIEAVQSRDFDLILCDFSLEEKHTGFEVIAAARHKDPNVPCALLTGYATLDTADGARENGIQVMFKPIEIAEFLQNAAALLRLKDESIKEEE